MTDAIYLGEVFITDLNENDVYDPKEDLVTDLSGKTLPSKEASQKLKKVLKAMNAKEWKGISLFWAQEYLTHFREAERLTKLGEVEEVDDLLSQAQDAVANLPISFDQTRSDRLRKAVRLQAIDDAMLNAQDFEKSKEWINLHLELQAIEVWYLELKADFGTTAKYDLKEFERLYQEACQQIVQDCKSALATASKSGWIRQTKDLITQLTYYAYLAKNRYQLDLSASQQEIDDWMQEAYHQGIPDIFNRLQNFAQTGQVQSFRRLLPELQTYMAEAKSRYGLTFQYTQDMIDNYYELALLEGIEDNYKLAEDAAKRGDRDRAEKLLELTQEYVDEYNQKYPKKKTVSLDRDRSYDILTCAWDKTKCP